MDNKALSSSIAIGSKVNQLDSSTTWKQGFIYWLDLILMTIFLSVPSSKKKQHFRFVFSNSSSSFSLIKISSFTSHYFQVETAEENFEPWWSSRLKKNSVKNYLFFFFASRKTIVQNVVTSSTFLLMVIVGFLAFPSTIREREFFFEVEIKLWRMKNKITSLMNEPRS